MLLCVYLKFFLLGVTFIVRNSVDNLWTKTRTDKMLVLIWIQPIPPFQSDIAPEFLF